MITPKEHLSAFQVCSFGRCPASFLYGIINYNKSFKDGNPMLSFGDAIHLTIEKLSKKALEENEGMTYLLSEKSIKDCWAETVSQFPQLVNKDMIQRGDDQLNFWLKQETIRKAKVVGIEVPFELYLPNGIKILGFIDRIEENVTTDENSLDCLDWKTGWLKESYDTAMMIYLIACHYLYPNKKITPKTVQLQHNYIEPYYFDKSDLDEFYRYLEIVRSSIDRIIERYNELEGKTKEVEEFIDSITSVNKFCYSCQRSKDQKCNPWIKHLYAFRPSSEKEDFSTLDIKELVDKYESFEVIAKGIDAEKNKLDTCIEKILYDNRFDGVEIEAGRWLNPFCQTRKKIDQNNAIKILIQYGKTEALSTKLKSVEEAMNSLPPEASEKLKSYIGETKGNMSWRIGKKQKLLNG